MKTTFSPINSLIRIAYSVNFLKVVFACMFLVWQMSLLGFYSIWLQLSLDFVNLFTYSLVLKWLKIRYGAIHLDSHNTSNFPRSLARSSKNWKSRLKISKKGLTQTITHWKYLVFTCYSRNKSPITPQPCVKFTKLCQNVCYLLKSHASFFDPQDKLIHPNLLP